MREPDIVRAAPSLNRIAGPLVEHLVAEMRLFGRLSTESVFHEERVLPYTLNRAALTLSLVELMEAIGGLSFASGAIPYCYNAQKWQNRHGTSGRVGEAAGMTASAWTNSMFLAWNLRQPKYPDGLAAARLLKAGLWRVLQEGVEPAVHLMFDLYDWGFFGRADLQRAVITLLAGRNNVATDEELVHRFLERTDRLATAEFISSEPGSEWIDFARPPADATLAVLHSLLQRAIDEVAKVREAVDIDDWFDGQIHVGGVIETVERLIDRFAPRTPLTWRARLAQLEEIKCDSGALHLCLFQKEFSAFASFTQITMQVAPVGWGVRSNAGPGWVERFYQERLLVPAGLKHVLLPMLDGVQPSAPDGGKLIPSEWSDLSYRAIHPWVGFFRPGEDPTERRTEFPRLSDEAAAEAEDQMLTLLNESLEDRDGGRLSDALTKVRHIRETYPYDFAAALIEGTAEAAAGNVEAAVEPVLRCLILSPRQKVTWRTAAEVLESLGGRAEALFCRAVAGSL